MRCASSQRSERKSAPATVGRTVSSSEAVRQRVLAFVAYLVAMAAAGAVDVELEQAIALDPDSFELRYALAEAYGVWIEKKFMGREYMGVERTTFVIGADGLIEAVLPQVKPNEHVEQLLEALAA